MGSKRTYKALTAKQTTKVKKYTKEGKSQGVIAKLLHVSKQRVATSQRKAKVGKRVASPFWKEVKHQKETLGYTHKEATAAVYHTPKYSKRRATRKGKKWKSYEERSKSMREIRESIDLTDEQRTALNEKELGEFYYGDTPH